MKNLFLVCTILLTTTLTLAQNLIHSEKTVFGNGYDQWSIGKEKNEMYITLQTPIGYKNTYNELLKILAFYGLKMEDTVSDETAFDDFEKMSQDCESESAYIAKLWATKVYTINWRCSKVNNGIVILLRSKSDFESVFNSSTNGYGEIEGFKELKPGIYIVYDHQISMYSEEKNEYSCLMIYKCENGIASASDAVFDAEENEFYVSLAVHNNLRMDKYKDRIPKPYTPLAKDEDGDYVLPEYK